MAELAPLSVQLYSLREEIQQDVEAVLRKVADMGYAGVEPYGGIDFEKAAPLIKALGMQAASMHAALPIGNDAPRILEMAAAYGVTYIICPYLPPENFTTLDNIKAAATILNEANAVVMDAGFKFAYHNHDFEFQMVDGRPAYDILKELLDPSVYLQVDTYWVKVAGYDPAALIRDLGERAPLLHIKDGPANREDPMTAVGDGVMDVPAIVQANAAHVEWLVVELDRCATDMTEALAKSYAYMTEKGLAHGR